MVHWHCAEWKRNEAVSTPPHVLARHVLLGSYIRDQSFNAILSSDLNYPYLARCRNHFDM